MRIRAALDSDLPELREIERAAGELFREIGMVEIAEDEPPSIEVLTGYVNAGRAWVAVLPGPSAGGRRGAAGGSEGAVDSTVAGYLIADLVDGSVHVEQVSVHPRWSGRGVGRLLIEHAADHARGIGAAALTLTTFADVAWNAPYYERCGFVVLEDGEVTPGLRAVREHEAAAGLDRWRRVCMRRQLTTEPHLKE
ncbi:GNAT family N-acetyltransferase [Actinoplanes utahensis]|uniref:GCN5 family acetyltransferase n=1 Tax=Actinoplanes utahensis TaxID=1869 RepID=A0A0A6UM06_ACTUT|nr:GNAT family N-acetyltransferase [Actinoplanes utahensis]KHD75314.1 GCN5 family acetyltransferase [Actinoplanes utahensis]